MASETQKKRFHLPKLPVPNKERTKILSEPKKLPKSFHEDRRSVYWINKLPDVQRHGDAPSQRIKQLALPKQDRYAWNRPTVTEVSRSAQQATPSERTAALAKPKEVHKDYKHSRLDPQHEYKSRMSARMAQRLVFLSTPKPHKIWTRNAPDIHDIGEFSKPIRAVTAGALQAHTTEHVEALALPKRVHSDYRPERSMVWQVSAGVMTATPTVRLRELAAPKVHKVVDKSFDPYAVSSAAMNAEPTERLNELSLPIPRKVRAKKTQ